MSRPKSEYRSANVWARLSEQDVKAIQARAIELKQSVSRVVRDCILLQLYGTTDAPGLRKYTPQQTHEEKP